MLLAKDIKNILMKNFLPNCNSIDEVMYGSRRRMADLVFFDNKLTTAIEIKSDRDSLSKLEGQLRDYKNVFDYTYIAVTEKFFPIELSEEFSSIGVILIKDSAFRIVKKARTQNKKKKEEIIFNIPGSLLRKNLSSREKHCNSEELKKKVSKKSASFISSLFISQLNQKLRFRNQAERRKTCCSR